MQFQGALEESATITPNLTSRGRRFQESSRRRKHPCKRPRPCLQGPARAVLFVLLACERGENVARASLGFDRIVSLAFAGMFGRAFLHSSYKLHMNGVRIQILPPADFRI